MGSLEQAGPARLNLLGAADAAAKIAAGEISSEALVRDCLARIEARDGDLHAWAFVDPERALDQARARDAAPAEGRGPLHGVPVGVKDVLDTEDMPTEYGSSIYRGHRPAGDSRCVAELRAAGAVILGKTATTQFASPVQIGVRNPHDTSRTPGVSSSGSAAAVADFMVPLANGTQTGGSVILPAAYCGLVGFKASLDGFDRTGIYGLKRSLDTLGYHARSVDDIALVWRASTGGTVPEDAGRPRVGVCRTPWWDTAEPCTQEAVEDAAAMLAAAGYDVSRVSLPPAFDEIEHAFRVISQYECRQVMAAEFRDHMDSMNGWLQETGKSDWSEHDHAAALATADAARRALDGIYDEHELLITPATAGEAPADLESISNSAFNRVWTLMHGPAMTLPVAQGPAGMPVGVQLCAREGADARLIAHARTVHRILRERMA